MRTISTLLCASSSSRDGDYVHRAEGLPSDLRPFFEIRCHCAPLTAFYCDLQKDEFLRLAINAIHNDLTSRNEAFQCIGLTFVGNSEWQGVAAATSSISV
jgi:hypothetical protein